MAIRHVSDLVTKNGNTYENAGQFFVEHGPVGSTSPNTLSVKYELLPAKNGLRRTATFENQARYDAYFPQIHNADSAKTWTSTLVSQETF